MKAHKIEEMLNTESRLVKLESSIDQINESLKRIEKRFDLVDASFIRIETRLEAKIDKVDSKLSSFKFWAIGIGVSAFLSVAGEIFNIALKMSAH